MTVEELGEKINCHENMFPVFCLCRFSIRQKYSDALNVLHQQTQPEFALHSNVLSLREPKWTELEKEITGQEKVKKKLSSAAAHH